MTKRGTPVEVAAPLAAADLIIGLGGIEFHQLTGFSGGAKVVAAGTASPAALEHNHRLSILDETVMDETTPEEASLDETAMDVLEGSVVRADMEEFALVAGLKFIVNVVSNEHGMPVFVTAGDPIRAHRIGCEAAARLLAVEVAEQADIVIASPGGSPRDDTVYQAQKTVRNALRAVRKGGIVVVAAQCGEGFGDPVFARWIQEAVQPAHLQERSRREFALGGHKAAFIAQAVQKARIFWVSGMAPADVRRAFMEPFDSLQEAVDTALAEKGAEASLWVMPWGGLTVPYLLQPAESKSGWAGAGSGQKTDRQ